jgi:RNase H-fold protein (predicted Holliday junction resolvase)
VPRGLDGQDTQQTIWSSKIFQQLQSELDIPVFQIDEAGTSKRAEEIRRPDQSIDSVAAGIMGEDFLREIQLGRVSGVSV